MPRRTSRKSLGLAVFTWIAMQSGRALAQAPPDPARWRVADAHADRVVLLPTAYTHPEGTFYFSSYDVAGLQVGYACTDSAQVTVTGTPPVGEDHIFPLDVSLKVAFARAPVVRLAAIGAASGIAGLEGGAAFVGRAGAVAQLCFEESCDASATMGSTLLLAGPALLMANGAGAIWPMSRWFALLLEVDTLIPLGNQVGEYHGVAAAPGVRFRGRSWGVDLAVARPLDVQGSPTVVPVIAATYRIVP